MEESPRSSLVCGLVTAGTRPRPMAACAQRVLFVRVGESPTRWGQWRRLREPQWALQGRD